MSQQGQHMIIRLDEQQSEDRDNITMTCQIMQVKNEVLNILKIKANYVKCKITVNVLNNITTQEVGKDRGYNRA